MCWISCRDTSEPSVMPSSTSTVCVRIGGMVSGPPGQRGDADGDHRAGNQPARQVEPQKQQAAGGADDERLERAENFGAVGDGGGHRGGDQAHAALWQIRTRGTNAPRDCSNAGAERFPAKWRPVRVKKTRQTKIQSPVPMLTQRKRLQRLHNACTTPRRASAALAERGLNTKGRSCIPAPQNFYRSVRPMRCRKL